MKYIEAVMFALLFIIIEFVCGLVIYISIPLNMWQINVCLCGILIVMIGILYYGVLVVKDMLHI
jgi:hypothetical protein